MSPIHGDSSYTNPTKIAEALRQAGERLRARYGDDVIPREAIQGEVLQQYEYKPSSIIPSDYCYNLVNEDPTSFRYCLYERVDQGYYKYLGPNYPYNGNILWRQKGGREQQVGSWKDGTFTLTLDPRTARRSRQSSSSTASLPTHEATSSSAEMQTEPPSVEEHIFGEIEGYPEGVVFGSRQELSEARIHRPLQANIAGSASEGAESIVLSGGYEDLGDEIIYTGQEGRVQETGQQIAKQSLTNDSLTLTYNMLNGLPVRVIRGATHQSLYAPKYGYRYDGLYRVEDYWRAVGKLGFDIWRFRLVKLMSQLAQGSLVQQPPVVAAEGTEQTPERRETRVLRIVRDTEQARQIKVRYDYHCQICDIRLEGSVGPYVEAAHIRPLGRPHNGPDTPDNILCLCPNHHILFDLGSIAIADDFSLIGAEGRLIVGTWHHINKEHLRYHREHYGGST